MIKPGDRVIYKEKEFEVLRVWGPPYNFADIEDPESVIPATKEKGRWSKGHGAVPLTELKLK